MNLSVFLPHVETFALQEGLALPRALARVKAWGIDYVEVNGDEVTDVAALRRDLEAAGLAVGGLYSVFDFGHDPQPQQRRRIAELARALGARVILAVPGFVREGEDRPALQEKAAEALAALCREAAPIPVTLEDYDATDILCGPWEELARFLGRVPGLGCTFDSGNFAFHGEDLVVAYDALAPHIRHVHLKDRAAGPAFGDGAQVSVTGRALYPAPVGGGFLPQEALIRRLRADGYDGLFAIEHFGARRMGDCIAASARWLQHLSK